MALNAAAITAAIADLEINGVTIKDITDIPLTVTIKQCPILMPLLDNWIGGATGSPDDETTFGTPSERMWVTHRNFRYIYLHKMLASGRAIDGKYADAIENIELLWTALTALDISGVDVENITHDAVGVLEDKAGNKFVGCFFEIDFKERINA